MKKFTNCENGRARIELTHKQVLNICDDIINNRVNNENSTLLKCNNTNDELITTLTNVLELSLCYGTTNKKMNSKLRAIYNKFSKMENLKEQTKINIKNMSSYLKTILDMDNLHKELGIN